eukprot:11224801-Lingulodinium_polyedra.AAC.1
MAAVARQETAVAVSWRATAAISWAWMDSRWARAATEPATLAMAWARSSACCPMATRKPLIAGPRSAPNCHG